MDLTETSDWNDAEACTVHLREKGVPVDDVKCFNQFTNLKSFTERCNYDWEVKLLQARQKVIKHFEQAKSFESYIEQLKIALIFFAFPYHNAHVERFFSLWCKASGQRKGTTCFSLFPLQKPQKQQKQHR